MREKKMKRWGNATGFLLAAVVLYVVLAAVGSTGYAAPAPKAAASISERAATVLDPFALRIVTVSNSQPGVKATALSVSFARPAHRHPVRIPVRPPRRSEFRPDP
jgi:uncharacterized protein (DUF58 family)